MNTNKKPQPKVPKQLALSLQLPLFAKQLDLESGSSFLRALCLADYILMKPTEGVQFLTWNGENFAWREPTEVSTGELAHEPMVNLQVTSRTSYHRSAVYPNSLLACVTEVYGLTKEAKDGVFRPAKILGELSCRFLVRTSFRPATAARVFRGTKARFTELRST